MARAGGVESLNSAVVAELAISAQLLVCRCNQYPLRLSGGSQHKWSTKCRSIWAKGVRLAMNAFKSVLFPVDFSLRCEATIPFVKEMVRHCRAKLTLLHVVEIPVDWYAAVTPSLHMPWDEFETQYKLGRECLGSFACQYFGDISHEGPVETICERGDPGYAIVAQAQSTGSDLIMMPTHGKGPFRSLFLGSVTARVLHNSECAV